MNAANPLSRRMTLAGYGAAATAGAVTVGLIAGVAQYGHKTATASSGTVSNVSTTTTRSGDDSSENESDDSGTTNVIPAPQNNAPVGGSHGS